MNLEVRSIGKLLTAPIIVDLETKFGGISGRFKDFFQTR